MAKQPYMKYCLFTKKHDDYIRYNDGHSLPVPNKTNKCNDIETGELRLAKYQYDALIGDEQDALEVVKISEHQYDAFKLIPDRIIIKPPTDCEKLYSKFMEANKAFFKKWANQNCRDYIGCWCCPNGDLCATFIVKPDRFLCLQWKEPIFKEKFSLFEPQLEIGGV